MIKPEDLTNRAVFRTPTDRASDALEDEAVEDEHERSTPDEPCPPTTPAAVEHGERTGGEPGPDRVSDDEWTKQQ